MFNFKSVLLITAGLQHVSGHGYAYSPRSRNWFAVEEGTEGQSIEGLPNKEYCPDCLNTNELPGGICGKTNSGSSYTEYLDSTGKEMPWISQEIYTQGQEIVVKHFYSTHHYGHISLSACNLGKSSTQECFDNPDNWLEFVRDNSYNMPKDEDYPERGYLKRGPMDFEMVFKLPDNVVGSEVLIQWRYITANSCIPEGYTEYFNWAIANPDYNVVPSDWKGANMQACDKYPQDGSKPDGGAPEQFWNCAEVTINSGTPTVPTPTAPIVSPTPGPVNTPAPIDIMPNPSGMPYPCCSWYSGFCEQPENAWCHASESNCEGACGGVYRDPYNQPQPTPTAPNPTMPNPTAPTPLPPTNIPTTGIPCCSINLKDCMSWCTTCHDSQSACENYEGNTFWMPWGEPLDPDSCIAITYSCVGHGKPCCPGMICNPDTSSAPCIVAPTAPVSSPTLPPVSAAPVSAAPVTNETPTPAPASSPTSSPVNQTPSPVYPTPSPVSPVAAPTSSPVDSGGCFSMDYKNCLPEGYPTDNLCNLVWLPDGGKSGCDSLWESCSQPEDCCGEAECFGDDDSAACVPPLPDCTPCDDVATPWMVSKGKTCADNQNTLNKRCNKDEQWTQKGFCKFSCFHSDNGYDAIVCCDEPASARNLRHVSH